MEDNFIYDMKLGTLRKYISVFDLVAVHIYETRRYYTYAKTADIPIKTNDTPVSFSVFFCSAGWDFFFSWFFRLPCPPHG